MNNPIANKRSSVTCINQVGRTPSSFGFGLRRYASPHCDTVMIGQFILLVVKYVAEKVITRIIIKIFNDNEDGGGASGRDVVTKITYDEKNGSYYHRQHQR
jgi:hypothetical protein